MTDSTRCKRYIPSDPENYFPAEIVVEVRSDRLIRALTIISVSSGLVATAVACLNVWLHWQEVMGLLP